MTVQKKTGKKVGNKRKHIIVIGILAIILLIAAYDLSTIPKNNPNLPKPSEFACSYDSDCPQNETCRREISSMTKHFFGEYKCRTKVWLGGKCETWSNCESGICNMGRCSG